MIPLSSPPLQWRCGDRWKTDLLEALAEGSSTEITRRESGTIVWQRDCETQLHQFTNRCVKYLLASPGLENSELGFPRSFAEAYSVKCHWLDHPADTRSMEQVSQAVMQEAGDWWPSNWCFCNNAMFCARSVVTASLDLSQPWSSTAQCAENLVLHLSFVAACSTMDCQDSEPVEVPGSNPDDGVVVRGVACPHMEDGEVAELANRAFDAAQTQWRERLLRELCDLIDPHE